MNPQWICVKRSYILDCKNMNWKFDPESPSSVQGLKHVHLQISQKIALFCSQVWKASCKEGCNFTIPAEIYWELIWGNKFCWHSPCHRLPLHANARCPSINPRHIPRKKNTWEWNNHHLGSFCRIQLSVQKVWCQWWFWNKSKLATRAGGIYVRFFMAIVSFRVNRIIFHEPQKRLKVDRSPPMLNNHALKEISTNSLQIISQLPVNSRGSHGASSLLHYCFTNYYLAIIMYNTLW